MECPLSGSSSPKPVVKQESHPVTGKRKEPDSREWEPSIKECFDYLRSEYEKYSQPIRPGEDLSERIKMQDILTQHVAILKKLKKPLMETRKNDMETQKRIKLTEELGSSSGKGEIAIDEKNLFSYFEALQLKSYISKPNAIDLEEAEKLYEAFCQFGANRNFPSGIQQNVAICAKSILADKACIYFKVGTKVFEALKINIMAVKSNLTNVIMRCTAIQEEMQKEGTENKPLSLPDISELAFQEILCFISNPRTYRLPKLKEEELKGLLIELAERAIYFDLPEAS